MDYPLISAVMLAGDVPYTRVQKAIQCFHAQDYPHKELIIVNNSVEYATWDGAHVVHIGQRLPAGSARERGVAAANGQLIAQFDCDAWHAPSRLSLQVNGLAQQLATAAVLTHALSYSFISGRASYHRNQQAAAYNTLLYIRHAGVYPDVVKGEELGLLETLSGERKIISLPHPEFYCKLYGPATATAMLTNNLVAPEHQEALRAAIAAGW